MKPLQLATLLITIAAIGCSQQEPNTSADDQNSDKDLVGVNSQSSDTINIATIDAASAQIDESGFMTHVITLSSDEYEGRAPSTPGGRKTVEYIEAEYEKMGLEKPFTDENGAKSYRQRVELIEQEVTNSPAIELKYQDGSQVTLPYAENSIVWSTRVGDAASIKDSELVFVGYGVVAPEFGWDDYAGVDMTGKTAVILVNDPGYRAGNEALFKGNTMTYYGRWTYKFEEAARQGAAGAIVVHETGAAGYPWEVVSGSWSGAQYMLLTEDGNANNVAVEGWISRDVAEQLFDKTGHDYDSMVALAGKQGFKPTPLTATASASIENASRRSFSYNVGGILPGRERADELFVYTAHWDHIGKRDVADDEDGIYNGAQDNATGTGGIIEIAQAFKALPQMPERSVMFLAVTAEESGLLGSKHYAENPPYPMAKHVAGINVDGMSTVGATDDVIVVGFGNSQMDDYLRTVAADQNRVLVQEPTPEKGFFYRSDHFNLAKQGVPMLYAEAGIQIREQQESYGADEAARYTAERYHKPSDEIHPEWDNGGIMQDLNAHFRIGVAIANSNDWPQWSEGNEFKAIREASLAQ